MGKKSAEVSKKKNLLKRTAIILGVIGLFAGGWFSVSSPEQSSQVQGSKAHQTTQQKQLDYGPLIGRWQRPDGGYILEIRSVNDNGKVDAAYFNPNPIHIAQAAAAIKDNAMGIFIELQDKGYPGATYRLLYDRNNNTLIGLYYQPAVGGTFDVVFIKKE